MMILVFLACSSIFAILEELTFDLKGIEKMFSPFVTMKKFRANLQFSVSDDLADEIVGQSELLSAGLFPR